MALLDILYRDEHLVAINKPDALLVHKSRQSGDAIAALQLLRDQIGRIVYPVHRLDRATSGVLIFALNARDASALCAAFSEHRVHKHYRAVVRGIPPEQGVIDHPVTDPDEGIPKDARTHFQRLEILKIDAVIENRPAVYSLLDVIPETGRRHQIRLHLKHLGHPIIGDTTHGRGAHNRFFRERFGVYRLLLHARSVDIPHPATGEILHIEVDETEERAWRHFRLESQQF